MSTTNDKLVRIKKGTKNNLPTQKTDGTIYFAVSDEPGTQKGKIFADIDNERIDFGGINDIVPIELGGTGAATAEGALANLGIIDSIIDIAETVTLNIVSEYTSSDDLETYRQEITSALNTNLQSMEATFAQLETRIGQIYDEINTQKQYVKLVNGELHIGKDGSSVATVYTNNTLEFKYNGTTVATFSNDSLEIRNIATENQISFFGDWAIRKGAEVSGKGFNLNDVWIGG